MDVASYFPNLSAVRHDEGEETVSQNDEEVATSNTIPGKRRFAMSGRKRHDPVLSTIVEVWSHTSLLPADSSIVCFLCLNKISGSVANFGKPCQCPLVFVHTTCALDNASFFGSTCSQCNQKYSPEPPRPRQTPSPVKSLQRMASDAPKSGLSTSSSGQCVLCNNNQYRTPEAAQKSDAQLIRPCFCGFLTHHGCVVELLERQKECQYCGVKYRYLKYGSFVDFCKRYSIQHICYVALFVFLIVFFVMALRGSLIFRRTAEFSPIVLSIISLFFFCVLVFACLFTVKHTILTRLPRFKKRYGQVTVVPYDPNVRSKKEALRSLEAARFHPCNEDDVPLNTVAVVDVIEEETPASDLSLGECMFGVSKSHRITSSTPLNKPKATVFESKA